MRLFVALLPPPPVLAEIGQLVDGLRVRAPELRWTRLEQWHLTLAFLGQVEERRLPALTERLARLPRRHAAFPLAFTGGGRFDGRVLWAGVSGDLPALRALADSASAAARRTGIALEERPYRPHLTLARARAPTELRRLVEGLSAYVGQPWQADRIELICSQPGPRPRYDTVGRWELAGRGPPKQVPSPP